jgi:hypothetical protein
MAPGGDIAPGHFVSLQSRSGNQATMDAAERPSSVSRYGSQQAEAERDAQAEFSIGCSLAQRCLARPSTRDVSSCSSGSSSRTLSLVSPPPPLRLSLSPSADITILIILISPSPVPHQQPLPSSSASSLLLLLLALPLLPVVVMRNWASCWDPPPDPPLSPAAATMARFCTAMRAIGQLPASAGDHSSIDTVLGGRGLVRLRTLGDGNCLFRALEVAHHGDDFRHAEARQQSADWISSHAGDFAPLIPGGVPAYVQHIRQPAVWGDNVDIVAYARANDLTVVVHHPDPNRQP